jgi:ketosteroid isomerase-like protein
VADRRAEIETVLEDYLAFRKAVDAGQEPWENLARYFTDDAVFIDPAWGRVEGLDKIRQFFVESMTGLEDWQFPVEFVAVDGDTVVVKWTQIIPGARPDGTLYQQSGVSTLIYAGDGKFRYEEDILNMAHVLEDISASGWQPGAGFSLPPALPNRDFSKPPA